MKNNLPALTGSPKQIAWAEEIRSTMIKAAELLTSNYHRLTAEGGETFAIATLGYTKDEAATVEQYVITGFSTITSAAAIIDHRNKLHPQHVQEAIKAEHRTHAISALLKK